MLILALDPGPTETGYCAYDGANMLTSGVFPNDEILNLFKERRELFEGEGYRLAIEMIASYGMPVGREVFETVLWTGRFLQAWHQPENVMLIYRQEVKLYVCKNGRAKDSNVRQGLIDMVGPQGNKKSPGPTYGIKSHAWAALGVAVTAADQIRSKENG